MSKFYIFQRRQANILGEILFILETEENIFREILSKFYIVVQRKANILRGTLSKYYNFVGKQKNFLLKTRISTTGVSKCRWNYAGVSEMQVFFCLQYFSLHGCFLRQWSSFYFSLLACFSLVESVFRHIIIY